MLNLGPLQLTAPLAQAALAGYSDAPMRALARQFGAAYALHEVVLDKSVTHSPRVRRKLLGTVAADDHPIGGQLMGAEPDQFGAAAALVAECGYDVVDINFGCPVKKVLGRCRGGFLLSDPPTAIAIIRAVRGAVPRSTPVTVKMRRGMDESRESAHKFFEIFDAAWDLGVTAITVHPRTVAQRYHGPSDWGFLARLKRHAGDRTILGSGDLYTAQHICRMLAETGVDGVSVARGCIGNPWIFREALALLAGAPWPEPPSVAEQGRVIRAHFDRAAATHGELHATRSMRKFGIKYADLHPHPKDVRMAFVAASNRAQWEAVLDRWYDPARPWAPGRRKTGPSELASVS